MEEEMLKRNPVMTNENCICVKEAFCISIIDEW